MIVILATPPPAGTSPLASTLGSEKTPPTFASCRSKESSKKKEFDMYRKIWFFDHFYFLNQGWSQPGRHQLLPARGQGRQQGHPGGQGPRGHWGAECALRRRHRDCPAHGDRVLVVLQGLPGEEEGGGPGGGKAGHPARGGQDGRRLRVRQVPGGGGQDSQGHQVRYKYHFVDQLQYCLKD